jgi:NAD+ diphosphatase
MDLHRPNFLSGSYIDRRAEAREDAGWVQAARRDPDTRYLINQGSAQLLTAGQAPGIALLTNDAPLVRTAPDHLLLLLGWRAHTRIVMLDLPLSVSPELPENTAFQELRPLAPLLEGHDAALLAYARALGAWRGRQLHCGVCGQPTEPTHAGHCLRCSNPACAQEFFPRLDPAIIVLVSDGERALLGRQPSWPPRRYSTIAGFVEPGESLEDAVAREVFEETGVVAHNIRYHSSQPWPFPSSLMLGFFASAAPESAVRLGGELEDARWFTRQQIQSGEALAPPTQSISWRLIETWLHGAA